MRKLIFRNCVIVFMLLLCACGCYSVPYTGRSSFLLQDESEENRLGAEAWHSICSKEIISGNPVYISALDRVGWSIAKVSARDDFNWEFKVFDSKSANAFCLPGGKVAVYSALFQYAGNDAELASVVGHEVGHAIARHGGERMSHGQIQQMIGEVGASLLEGSAARQVALIAYGAGSNVLGTLPFSRKHEYEADHIGLMLMAKAGYNPSAAISFWEKFSSLSDTNEVTEFFSTHPMGEKRISELQRLLPKALEIYNQVQVKKGLGVTYK